MTAVRRRGSGLRRTLACALAAGATLGAAASAQATFPGPVNGKIAYASGSDIYVVNPDGSGATNLTNSPGLNENSPEWSPDGTKIAFSRGAEVRVMDANGANNTLLYSVPGGGDSPVFSPDGTRIAHIGSSNTIAISMADGSGSVPFTSPAGIQFLKLDWSPDGTTLAAHGLASGVSSIYLVDVATGVATPLVGGDGAGYDDPEWSSDGTRLFYHRNDFALSPPVTSSDVWAINPDGTGNVQITTAAGADRFPVPSPDGTRVAYAKLATLSVMNPDGTGSVSLGVNSVTNPDWQPAQEVPVVAPVVSKTAFSQVNREIRWRVRKSADASKAGWDPKDGSVAVRYGVRVTRSLGAPEAPVVYGAVRIQNPNEVPISITEVEDLLPDASCSRYVPSAPLVVPAGGEQFVSYSCALSEVPGGTLTNTARVYWSYDGEAGEAVQATADVDFSDPRVQVYGEMAVRVTDTMSGAKTRVLAEAMETSKTFTYTRYLRATDKCRWFGNTARLVVDGGAAEQQLQPAPGPAPEFEVIASDDAGVKICPPPPPPVKPDPTDPKAPPVVVIDNGNGSTPTKVPTKTTDNPKGPVIDSPVSKGRLVVSKRADSRRVRVGDVVTWTIRVRNAGKADLKDVVLVDRLPAHLRAVDTTATGTAKARQRARVIKVTVGDLLVGQSTTVRVATKVVARPRMTRRVAREASRIRSKQVRVRTLRRARLGVVCNTAFAKAQATRARAGVGCIRVLAPVKPTTPEVVQTPEN